MGFVVHSGSVLLGDQIFNEYIKCFVKFIFRRHLAPISFGTVVVAAQSSGSVPQHANANKNDADTAYILIGFSLDDLVEEFFFLSSRGWL